MGAMFEKGQTKRYSRVASFSGGGKSKKPMSDEDVEATEESEANPFGKGTTKVLNESKKMAIGGATKVRPKARPMPRPAKPTARSAAKGVIARAVSKQVPRTAGKKAGGTVKGYSGGGRVASRADGCAARGRTRGTIV
jgi:hypothetical protein